MQKRQKIVPNPAISSATVARRSATPETPSERAHIRAATVAQQQRDERIRTEALACDEAPAPAPTLREELNANRRREIGAPMATPMFDPDPVMAAIARLPLMLLMAAFLAGLALGRAL